MAKTQKPDYSEQATQMFSVADVNNILSAITCYLVGDMPIADAIADIGHTCRYNCHVTNHIAHCLDIIKHNN